jgi:hypothetical protein
MGEGLTLPCPKIVRGQKQLTPEQEAYARTFVHERTSALLSTVPINEQEAEEHLRVAYRVVGLKPPTKTLWFDSPSSFVRARVRGGGWARGLFHTMSHTSADVWDMVWNSPRAFVQANVKESAGSSCGMM